jgi:hypothetical protein
MTVIPPGMFERLRTTPLRDLLRGRVSGALAWQRHVAICGLPDALKGVVLEVTRRTGLWRSEKVEVAQELIAHFYDGLDAGVGEEELIKRFGDVKVAAKLIKRAKKRGRGWPWHVWRRSVQALGVLFLVYVGMGVWFALKQPVVSVDYVAKINAGIDAVPVEEHAWPIYRKAWDEHKLLEMWLEDLYVPVVNDQGLTLQERRYPKEPGWDKVHALLVKQQGLLEPMRLGGQKQILGMRMKPEINWQAGGAINAFHVKTGGPVRTDMNNLQTWAFKAKTPLEFISEIRKGAVLLSFDMLDAMESSDTPRAVSDYRAMVGMARQISRNGTMLEQLAGLSNFTLATNTLQVALTLYPGKFNREELASLAHITSGAMEVCKPDFAAERMMMLDFIQHVYSDDGSGDGNITYAGYRWMMTTALANYSADMYTSEDYSLVALGPVALCTFYSRAESTAFATEFLDETLRVENQPLWVSTRWSSQGPSMLGFDEEFKKRHGGLAKWRKPWVWVALLPMRPTLAFQMGKARAEASQVVLGLEAYKLEHGAYPTSLGALVPKYLARPPIDHSTGQRLLLRYQEGRPVVYGKGLDGKDDGGVLTALGTWEREASLNLPAKKSEEKDWILFPVRLRLEGKASEKRE